VTGEHNAPYRRRFPDPRDWPSNRPGPSEQPQQRVNELSWWLAGEQVADEFTPLLRAEAARLERMRAAQELGRSPGDPGE
jgi:hypothetical protein